MKVIFTKEMVILKLWGARRKKMQKDGAYRTKKKKKLIYYPNLLQTNRKLWS